MLPGIETGKIFRTGIRISGNGTFKNIRNGRSSPKNAQSIERGRKTKSCHCPCLINDPLIIMGDEPTGNLDKKNSDLVFDIFNKLT